MFKTTFIIFVLCFSLYLSATDKIHKPDDWWYLAGPISLPQPKKYDREYYKKIFDKLPETFDQKVMEHNALTTFYGTAVWWYVPPVHEQPKFFRWHLPEHSLYFAQFSWVSPVKQNAELRLGSDDAVCVWHNEKKIKEYPLSRGYRKLSSFVRVTLSPGTNNFMFALINGRDSGALGARLYPSTAAIIPGLFLDTISPVETGEFIEVDYYWMPAAGRKNRPIKQVYTNRPLCERIMLTDFNNEIVTQIINREIVFPYRFDMKNLENGVYKIKSFWNGKLRERPFFYSGNHEELNPTKEFFRELARANDFFTPEYLFDKMFGTGKEKIKIYAYKSKYDEMLLPYIVYQSKELSGKTNLPLIVHLKEHYPLERLNWPLRPGIMKKYKYAITLTPYGRGNAGYIGLAERDVLETIELVCKEYPIDRDRIYLEGCSLGAGGCWKIGGRHPDIFAAMTAKAGYDLLQLGNFVALPVWQCHGAKANGSGFLKSAINYLNDLGNDDARCTIVENAGMYFNKPELNKKIIKWMLSKRRNAQPDKVIYSTYGDIDGAYWVRNIMPKWFGRMAVVEAVIQVSKGVGCQVSGVSKEEIPLPPFTKGGIIHVRTDNVASFSLDLRKGRFLKFKNWEIVIDDEIKTNAISGEMFAYEFYPDEFVAAREQSELVDSRGQSTGSFFAGGYIGGLRKRNGFCGGMCDVVCDSFIFAYSAGDENAEKQARKFNNAITGLTPYKFDGKFKVVPDTELTSETCSNHNVILFTSAEKSSEFLEGNIDKLPAFSNQFAFVYPNPVAPNRYLLTVTMTNFTPRILMKEHSDIILGYRRGSFDVNWNKVQWQDEYKAQACGHDHDNKQANNSCKDENHFLKNETKYKEPKWKDIGGIICLVIFGGAALYYFLKKGIN